MILHPNITLIYSLMYYKFICKPFRNITNHYLYIIPDYREIDRIIKVMYVNERIFLFQHVTLHTYHNIYMYFFT